MLKDSKFSLLLPVYAGDNADFLRLAVASSVNEQTLPPSELVIVQDGPVGEQLAQALNEIETQFASDGEVQFCRVQLAENQGLCAALNAGLAACSYEIVARMDADDVSYPDRFEQQLALLETGFDLVGSGMTEFETDPSVVAATRVPPVGAERIREHARTHNPFNHPTMMYRRSAVQKAGGYQPFGKMEDYWLGIRLIESGARVQNIAAPLLAYRVGAGAFARRGGWAEARTEWKLQGAMKRMGFITTGQYLRNVVLKGAYRLMPATLKRVLFRNFVAGGLAGDRKQ